MSDNLIMSNNLTSVVKKKNPKQNNKTVKGVNRLIGQPINQTDFLAFWHNQHHYQQCLQTNRTNVSK